MSVPFESSPAVYRLLVALVTSLLRFVALAIFCKSWAPWCRIIITVFVVLIIVLILGATGVTIYMPLI